MIDPRIEIIINKIKYKWSGWYGCQLESFEFRRLPAGTERELNLGITNGFQKIRLFSTRRTGYFTVRHTWSITLSGDIDKQNAQIREFRNKLRSLL